MDDLIAQFTSITSAPPAQALQYLGLTDNNLEQAIQLFFEDPNLATGSPQLQTSTIPRPAGPTGSRPSYTEDASEVIHIESDNEESEDLEMADVEESHDPASAHQPAPSTEDDEEIARRLQEEMYQSAPLGPEGVRAPISRTTETLVGPGASWGSSEDDINSLVSDQLLRRQRRRAGRPSIFNQRDTVWDHLDEEDVETRAHRLAMATGGASTSSTKSNMLAEMYRPPFEIMSRLPWDEAREQGREEEKWLLVNVQDPSIFDCQVLNRDIWKNQEIMDVIRESFVFLQYNRDDTRGSSYVQYYFHGSLDNQDAYPHIAIVDPRTGEQVKVWSGAPIPKPQDFLMQLFEFLDRYSLKANVRNPIAKRKAERKEFDIGKMSEEEMLQIAMENSLAAGGSIAPVQEDPDALTKSQTLDKGKMRLEEDVSTKIAQPESTNGVHAESASPFSCIPSDRPHTEPQPDPASTTRIQFRHSGGRQVRRFALSDPVQRIYEWLKASPIEGKEGIEFDLIFMGKNLINLISQTIEEAGLKNATVMVEFLGQEDDE
jgi:UBX domain-containing protein 7